MIQGRDIIIVGLQPWDIAIGSNCKNIAIELSKHNRVLYVNPPLDRITYIKKNDDPSVVKRINIIKGKSESLTEVFPNLWNLYPSSLAESINWITNKSIFSSLNRLNNQRLAKDISEALISLKFSDFILFNDQSMVRCYHLKELLNPSYIIYYIRDNLSSIPYFKRHALDMEHKLIEQADAVATNSDFLAQYAKNYNLNSKMVGQGCDFSQFSNPDSIEIAEELKCLNSPIIGYVGFLTEVRLDIPLLVFIAQSKPEWNLVLVGPEDNAFKLSELHYLNNVHFLGNKNTDTLASYIKGFDVALNPQLINEVTMGNYPRKIDEYLAMGKPVVATKTPFMEYFKDYTYLATTNEEYVIAIEKALSENNNSLESKRIAFALTHTWENNVNEISKLIENSTVLTR